MSSSNFFSGGPPASWFSGVFAPAGAVSSLPHAVVIRQSRASAHPASLVVFMLDGSFRFRPFLARGSTNRNPGHAAYLPNLLNFPPYRGGKRALFRTSSY